MPPAEYIEIDSVVLNGTDGSTGWWCDFDLSAVPLWGLRVTKGSPTITIPHADGDLEVAVHVAAVDFTLLGVVYGDYDQSGAHVSGFENQRLQLADNLDILMQLAGGASRPLSYVLYDRTYTADAVVVGLQSTTSGPLDKHPTGPIAQPVALKLSIAAGLLELTG